MSIKRWLREEARRMNGGGPQKTKKPRPTHCGRCGEAEETTGSRLRKGLCYRCYHVTSPKEEIL